MQPPTTLERPPDTAHPGPTVASSCLLAAVVGIAVGVLTAYAQGWLGGATASFANSAGPWSLAAIVVARRSRRLVVGIAAATITLACSELGYVVATEVRGGSSATSTVVFWLTAAVLAGPPIGVAAAWSTRRDGLRGVGWAVIGGVLIGEGAYGWSTVADTTDWRYWSLEALLGAVVVGAAVVGSRRIPPALAATGTAAATALVVFVTARSS